MENRYEEEKNLNDKLELNQFQVSLFLVNLVVFDILLMKLEFDY
jgi:hypothetical protein